MPLLLEPGTLPFPGRTVITTSVVPSQHPPAKPPSTCGGGGNGNCCATASWVDLAGCLHDDDVDYDAPSTACPPWTRVKILFPEKPCRFARPPAPEKKNTHHITYRNETGQTNVTPKFPPSTRRQMCTHGKGGGDCGCTHKADFLTSMHFAAGCRPAHLYIKFESTAAAAGPK